MSKVVACIIARTVSTRLPLKVLRDLKPGVSMIDFLINRIKSVKEIDEIYLCTSTESVDDIMVDVADRNQIKLYRGSADAVIERMLDVAKIESADVLLRITGDNPLGSIEYLPEQLALLEKEKLDYVRVVDVPIGATIEVMKTEALTKCYSQMDPDVSEYLMLFLFEPEKFKCGIIKAFNKDYSDCSVTVDTPDDLKRTVGVISRINKPTADILLKDIVDLYDDESVQLPAMRIKFGGTIKYPYGKVISFDEFDNDMKRRKQNSILKKLYE